MGESKTPRLNANANLGIIGKIMNNNAQMLRQLALLLVFPQVVISKNLGLPLLLVSVVLGTFILRKHHKLCFK